MDPAVWPEMLDAVARAAGATGALLLQPGRQHAEVPRSAGIADLVDSYFQDGWTVRDSRERSLSKMLRHGVAVDQDVVTTDSIARDPLYAEFLAPRGFRWWAGIGFRSAESLWCVSLQRTFREGMFEPEEQEQFAGLVPMLSEVATLSKVTGGARLIGMTDALDLVQTPAAVLDRFGKVLRVNFACDLVFDDWLRVRKGRLFARDRRAAGVLSDFVDLLAADANHRDFQGRKLIVARGERLPIILEPLSLSGAALGPFAAGRVLLLLHDLERRPAAVSKALLITLFGLTNAEAALAALLSDGETLASSADALGIAKETARGHLKRVFAKTETNRQTELVALLARLPSKTRMRM